MQKKVVVKLSRLSAYVEIFVEVTYEKIYKVNVTNNTGF